MKKDRMPSDPNDTYTILGWVALGLACVTILLFSFAELKQAGTQYAQSSVFRGVR